jgi:hypothetical protein
MRKGSPFFWYEFELDGQRYRGSTKLTDRAQAEVIADCIYNQTLDARGLPAPRLVTQVRLPDRAYIIRGKITGLLKIGIARDVKNRIADLQSGSPDILELIWSGAGCRGSESEVHQEFADLRLHGEWFTPDPRIDDFLAICELTSDLFDAFVVFRRKMAA